MRELDVVELSILETLSKAPIPMLHKYLLSKYRYLSKNNYIAIEGDTMDLYEGDIMISITELGIEYLRLMEL